MPTSAFLTLAYPKKQKFSLLKAINENFKGGMVSICMYGTSDLRLNQGTYQGT